MAFFTPRQWTSTRYEHAETLLPPRSRAATTVTRPAGPESAAGGRPGQAGWPSTVRPLAHSEFTQQPARAGADASESAPASAAMALTRGATAAGGIRRT